MKRVGILVLIILMSSAYGAIPTVEGLFRHPNNQELTGNFVLLKLMVEEVPNTDNLEQTKLAQAGNMAEPLLKENKKEPKYFKIIFSTEKEGVTQLLQAEYENGQMRNSGLLRSRYFPDLSQILENNVQIERHLFYSMVAMYALNDSKFISNFLSKHGEGFEPNKMIINEDKFKLLNEYRTYLTAIKDDESLKETIESPLAPQDEEKNKLVKEVMRTSMYKPSERVRLERKGGEFYWHVDLSSIQAYFSNVKHRLRTFEVNTPSGNMSLNLGDYILFDGIHELPKIVYFRDLLDRRFKIRFLSFSNWPNKGKSLQERAKEYLKLETKLRKARGEVDPKPTPAPKKTEPKSPFESMESAKSNALKEVPVPINFIF